MTLLTSTNPRITWRNLYEACQATFQKLLRTRSPKNVILAKDGDLRYTLYRNKIAFEIGKLICCQFITVPYILKYFPQSFKRSIDIIICPRRQTFQPDEWVTYQPVSMKMWRDRTNVVKMPLSLDTIPASYVTCLMHCTD